MSHFPIRFLLSAAAFTLIGMGFTPRVAAQAQPTAPGATEPGKAPDPALKGPAVGNRPLVRGTAPSGFGPDAIEKKKAGGKKPMPPKPMPEFLKSLDVLRAAPTPEAIRLTADEDAKIKAIVAALDMSVKEYMDTNRAEIDTLRGKLSPSDRAMLDQQLQRGGPIRISRAGFGGKVGVAKQRGKQPGASPAGPAATPTTAGQPSKEDAAKTRARLVEIYSARPKSEDAQAKIMGILTPDQLTFVDKELAAHDGMTAPRRHARKGKIV